jgi:hypothetical protein
MADNEPHAAVQLLLKRMDSHPEEFRLKDPSYHDRWYNHMSAINTYGNEADKAALAAKIRDIRMGVIHEEVMEELLNGEERRRKENEEQEYERNLSKSVILTKKQQLEQVVQDAFVYDSDLDRYENRLAGRSPNVLPVANGGTNATNQIKEMLGIKK